MLNSHKEFRGKTSDFPKARNGFVQLNLHKTAEVCQVINEVKQLADIICNGWTVGIHSLQMLFIHFADSYRETRLTMQY